MLTLLLSVGIPYELFYTLIKIGNSFREGGFCSTWKCSFIGSKLSPNFFFMKKCVNFHTGGDLSFPLFHWCGMNANDLMISFSKFIQLGIRNWLAELFICLNHEFFVWWWAWLMNFCEYDYHRSSSSAKMVIW